MIQSTNIETKLTLKKHCTRFYILIAHNDKNGINLLLRSSCDSNVCDEVKYCDIIEVSTCDA